MEAIIKSHNITLTMDELTLRPMNDEDFDVLLKWNSDPDVLYFSEGDDVEKYSLDGLWLCARRIIAHATNSANWQFG